MSETAEQQGAPPLDGPDANAVRMTDFARELGYGDADVIKVAYREPADCIEHSTHFGIAVASLIRVICTRLQLAPSEITLERVREPRLRTDMAWIVRARPPEPGRRVARVAGPDFAFLQIELHRAVTSQWRPRPLPNLTDQHQPQQEAAA